MCFHVNDNKVKDINTLPKTKSKIEKSISVMRRLGSISYKSEMMRKHMNNLQNKLKQFSKKF
jgi:geranylgeranyl pyrophosphate synthase